jgi:putative SOS response-associated peptidase YedK
MCGRFTYRLTWREIHQLYRLTAPATPERNLQARYNICPTTTIDVVIERDAARELVPIRWGLVSSWWKKKAKDTPSTAKAVSPMRLILVAVASSFDRRFPSHSLTTLGSKEPGQDNPSEQRRMNRKRL